MSRRININLAVAILSLATICFGVRYAIAQEDRRTPQHLESMYRELNRQCFSGELPHARIQWSDLTDEQDEGLTYQWTEDYFVIQIDRRTNANDDELLDTVKHETCHVATWQKEDDVHGPLFQSCMTTLKSWKP
jgi:predicted SprT family Zn-dependent metalloprotease